jgi:hypothetical protein
LRISIQSQRSLPEIILQTAGVGSASPDFGSGHRSWRIGSSSRGISMGRSVTGFLWVSRSELLPGLMGLAHRSAGSGTSKWPEAVSSSPTLNHRRIGLRSPSHSAISLSLFRSHLSLSISLFSHSAISLSLSLKLSLFISLCSGERRRNKKEEKERREK